MDRFTSIRFEKNIFVAGILVLIILVSAFFAGKAGFEKNMSALSYVTPQLSAAEASLDRISNYKLKNVYLVSTGKNPEEALRNHEKLAGWIDRMKNSGLVENISDAGPFLLSGSLQEQKISSWNA